MPRRTAGQILKKRNPTKTTLDVQKELRGPKVRTISERENQRRKNKVLAARKDRQLDVQKELRKRGRP